MRRNTNTLRHKMLAWLLVIAMAVSMAPVTASAATPHTHDSESFTPGVGQGVISETCSLYLVHNETVNNDSGIVVSGSGITVDICLNGHTLDLGGKNIEINNGATLNIYDCAGGGGKIKNGSGQVHGGSGGTKGGAFYVKGATLNIYGGTIVDNNADWGGAIFIEGTEVSGKGTVNMYGGTICGNTATKGGGGIEVEDGAGYISETGKFYGSFFNMYGGSIINNEVTTRDGLYKGGGVHVAKGDMKISGTVNITGNTVKNGTKTVGNNVYLRNLGVQKSLIVEKVGEGSRIGVSAQDVEASNITTTVTSGYTGATGKNIVKYFFVDNTHSKAVYPYRDYALIYNNGELEIQEQTHSWTYYPVGTNQIRAYCKNTNHQCAFRQGANELTLTLNAKDMEYTGEQYDGISYGEEEETKWTYAGLTMPPVQYTGTSAAGVQYSNTTPPTDAGSYTVSITVGGATATANFTIAQKPITDAVITLDFDKKHQTGDDFTQGITSVKVDGIDAPLNAGEDKDYTVDGSSVQVASQAGIYRIKINGQNNFTGSATAEWKITQYPLMTGLSGTVYSTTYDGQPHSTIVSVTIPTDAEVTYSETENGTYTDQVPAFTTVGVHTAYYKIEKEGYEPETGTLTVTITPGSNHNITMGSVDNGRITASVNGEIVDKAGYGSEVTLTATPDRGYQFSRWIVSNGAIQVSDIYNNKFTMPNADVEMLAEFVAAPGSSSGSTGGSGTPSTPTAPTEDYTIPVKNENTAEVKAEIKDGTANVSEITTDTSDKVINNKDTESKVDTITIDLSGAKQEVTGVTLSKKSVETLAKATGEKDNGIETATIELSKATVVLDNKTLETLVEQAKGSQIELVVADTEQNKLNTAQQTTLNEYQVATTFEAYFTSDGQRIHDFNGGKAVVSIKFEPEAGKDASYYHLVYVADDGKLTRYKTKYQGGKLMFTTTHFSDYAVIYDTSEKNETEDESGGTDLTPDTTYRKLALRATKSTKTTNVLKWNKVADADGYVIYGNKCNSKGKIYKVVQQAVIKNSETTTWTDKNLASGTYYKYYIKAYKLVNGKKVWLAKSKVIHVTTAGSKYGNAKSVKVNKTTVPLAVGKTFTIKAEQVVTDLPIKKHTEIKFESSNSKVASVTSKGVIKAKKKGTCYIYVYAQNGMYKRIKVTVK